MKSPIEYANLAIRAEEEKQWSAAAGFWVQARIASAGHARRAMYDAKAERCREKLRLEELSDPSVFREFCVLAGKLAFIAQRLELTSISLGVSPDDFMKLKKLAAFVDIDGPIASETASICSMPVKVQR